MRCVWLGMRSVDAYRYLVQGRSAVHGLGEPIPEGGKPQ